MFEKFLSGNVERFRQRYEGTFGFYCDETGKRLLTKLSVINDNGVLFVDAQGVEYTLRPDVVSNIGFEFIPPASRWHNAEDGAYLVQRVAARQFQRGVSGKNVQIHRYTPSPMPLRVDFTTLGKLYNGVSDRMAALNRFRNKETESFALSDQLATAGGSLFLYEQVIGTCESKDAWRSAVVTLKEPSLWKTEVQDAFRTINVPVEVN